MNCCSVTNLCPTLSYLMNCSTPGFPVLHYLPEFAQTYVHWVSDIIQPSHPLSPLPPLALSLDQHQGLFQRIGSSHQVTKVLELQLQHQSFQWIFRGEFPLGLTGLISLLSKSLLQHHSLKASVVRHAALFMLLFSHLYMITEKTVPLTIQAFVGKVMSLPFNMLSRFIITFLPRS